MDSKELMIGSLVEHNGYVYKVTSIYGNAKFVDLFPCKLRNKENVILGPLTIMEKEISPISLSREILKANGLEYDNFYGGYVLAGKDSNVIVEIGDNGLYEGGYQDLFYIAYSCRFVHELQGILRVCGRNDIADNFKIQ